MTYADTLTYAKFTANPAGIDKPYFDGMGFDLFP